MAKTTEEALARWQDAEDTYRRVIQQVFDGHGVHTKDRAIEIESARVKADKRLDTYLRHALKH